MGDNDNETLTNVTSATWDFEDEAFDEISDEAKNFISNLLKKDMKWVLRIISKDHFCCLQNDHLKMFSDLNFVDILLKLSLDL